MTLHRPINDPLAQCAGKAPLTWAQAVEITRRATAKIKGKKVSAYHCSHCRAWHVGNPPKKIRRPR